MPHGDRVIAREKPKKHPLDTLPDSGCKTPFPGRADGQAGHANKSDPGRP